MLQVANMYGAEWSYPVPLPFNPRNPKNTFSGLKRNQKELFADAVKSQKIIFTLCPKSLFSLSLRPI